MESKGVIGSVFDLSFTEFVTTRVVKLLFILGVLVAGIATLSLILTGFHRGFFFGVVALLFSPLVFLLYTILMRIWCEMVIVIFRIAENTGRLVEQAKQTPQ